MQRTTEEQEQLNNCKDTLKLKGWVVDYYRGSGWFYIKDGTQINFFTGMREVIVVRSSAEFLWKQAKDFKSLADISGVIDKMIYLLGWTPEQKVMHENENYYIDGNGNAWSKEHHTLLKATTFSGTLEDCTNCIDCQYCEDCIDCENCRDSKHLRNCNSCNHCEVCQYCENCTNCIVCENCVKCENCNSCDCCKHAKDKKECYENIDRETFFEQD